VCDSVQSVRWREAPVCSTLRWRQSCHLKIHVSLYPKMEIAKRKLSRHEDTTRIFFPLASVSRLALGATQPPIQWVPCVLSPEVKQSWGMMLTTHPHLVPRSKMSRSCTSSLSSTSVACHGTALLYTSYLQL
jgi:hypothetical protein